MPTLDDRHQQHTAARAAEHRDNAERQRDGEQHDRPDPPRNCAATGDVSLDRIYVFEVTRG